MFFPSILFSERFAFVTLAKVGNQSIPMSGVEIFILDLISLGYQTIQGTLCPPSHVVPFPSLYIPVEPACSP